MNIHLLCKRYYTNKDLLSDRFGRLYHLPVQLTRLGASVSVTAIDYRNRKPEAISAQGVTFHTAPATFARLPGLIPNLYRATHANRPDILIASGDSHIGYIGLQIARRLNVRFVFDVYDYYPAFTSNRIPGMKTMFRSAVKEADLVICASNPLRHVLSSLNEKILLVENGVDRKLFTPEDMGRARKTFGLEEKASLIGYFGSITPARGPLLIEACRQLREEMPCLRLIMAGQVTDVTVAESWITYLGPLPQESIPELISACDVVTVPYARDIFNSMAGACKIAEYMACGKPVVATRVSGHERIFKDVPGSLCDPDPDDMARVLRRQLANPVVAPFPESMDWETIGRVLHKSLVKMIS